jgi:glyoxylase-like metal-dependent hydrolase (beta-lactamase superfamily II)
MFDSREVAPDVVRILMARRFLGRDLYPASCYVLRKAGVMVDSGSSRFSWQTLAESRRFGIRTILLTHAHEDHTGGASLISETLGARCLAHPDAIPALSNPGSLKMFRYRKFLFGIPRPCQAKTLAVGDYFETEGVRLRVIYSPGHSPDHVAFFDEEKGWLFAGDVYIPTRDKVFFGIGCDLNSWIETLRSLAQLKPTLMFTGMGVVSKRPSKVLMEKANRLADTAVQVMGLQSRGLDEKQIARELFPRDRSVRWVTGGDFSAVNFVRACLRSGQAV